MTEKYESKIEELESFRDTVNNEILENKLFKEENESLKKQLEI